MASESLLTSPLPKEFHESIHHDGHDGLIHEIPLVKRLVSNDCITVLEFLTQPCP